MDKRKEANARVKNAITNAFFELLNQKPIAEVTITEIIQKAQVARASFYRNYQSKEDVMVTLVRDILERYRRTADYDLTKYYSYQNVSRAFSYFMEYKQYVLNIYNSGFGTMLLEELNQFHESIAGTMPASSLEKYYLYLFIGALYNTAIVWLKEERPASVEDITNTLLSSTNYTPALR